MSRSKLKENDILFSIAGTFGRIGVVTSDILPANTNQALAIIRLGSDMIRLKFLYYVLKSHYVSEQTKLLIKGVAQFNLSLEQVENLLIPEPPIPIQDAIIKEINEVENKEKNILKQIDELRNKILSEFEKIKALANNTYRLDDSTNFEVFIGKRVLKSEINTNIEIGTPVYSANVFEPFGSINKSFLKEFNKPSILWGIDGDWMVNVINKDKVFYPTDHCGVIRIKNESISIHYLAMELENIGRDKRFSRSFRASTERIKDIRISMPNISLQLVFDEFIETTQEQILKKELELLKIKNGKMEILKKYLE